MPKTSRLMSLLLLFSPLLCCCLPTGLAAASPLSLPVSSPVVSSDTRCLRRRTVGLLAGIGTFFSLLLLG